MGTVLVDNVAMTGLMHKNGFAVFNYADIAGLTVGGVGSSHDLDLSALATDWGQVFNIDGILATVDASPFNLALPAISTTVTELQGDKAAQPHTNQTIIGTDGNDRLIGKGGNDRLIGGAGNDELYGHDKPGEAQTGDTGNDTLEGGSGNDLLSGGAGNDILIGGAGADIFVFTASHGSDTIQDFEIGTDKIRLEGAGFSNFAALVIQQITGATTIDTGQGTITLVGIAAGTLSASDFVFV